MKILALHCPHSLGGATRSIAKGRAQEKPEDYKLAQSEIGQALTSAATAVLAPTAAAELSHAGSNNEFALRLGGCMSEWGSKHIHTLTQDQRTTFLQQVPPAVTHSEAVYNAQSVLPELLALLQLLLPTNFFFCIFAYVSG